jgi:hypothetical protein
VAAFPDLLDDLDAKGFEITRATGGDHESSHLFATGVFHVGLDRLVSPAATTSTVAPAFHQAVARNFQFRLFKAVGGQNRDLWPFRSMEHFLLEYRVEVKAAAATIVPARGRIERVALAAFCARRKDQDLSSKRGEAILRGTVQRAKSLFCR